jgi:hypothetical protein
MLLLLSPRFCYISRMGEIKSALELALERTKDVKSDPESLRRHEAVTDGKRLYAKIRNGESVDLAATLKEQSKERRRWMRQGLFDVALSNLNLPQTEADLASLDTVGTVLDALVRDRGVLKELLGQIRQFFSQYLDDRRQLMETLRRQFEPRMKQKEQQYAQQYGRQVKLDPSQDPEFAQALQANMEQLDGQYRGALSEVYDHLKSMFDA